MGIDFILVFMIGLGLSMDAFAVAVSSGMAITKVKLINALKIGLFFGIAQGSMPVLGYALGSTFSGHVQALSPWIAFILLMFIGGRMIREATKKEDFNDIKDPLYTKTLLLLAIATSIDALAVGVTFAVSGQEIYISSSVIAITTFIVSSIGVYIGKGIGKVLKNRAEILGGAILILIGLKILLEYYEIF